MSRLLFSALLMLGIVCAHADDAVPSAVTEALHSMVSKGKIDSITPAPLPGFYVVIIEGHVLYVSADGKFLIDGAVYDVPRHRELGDEQLVGVRKAGVARIPQDKRLVFAPPHPKYKVTVFTDVDCPYCRQFHKQIADYNRLGIEVDYVLFPLAIHPGADKKAETVWCSADRNTAYTEAMNGQNLPAKTCPNPIAELTTQALGMGLNGTPAIVAEDGSQLGGYLPPEQLAQRLDALAAHKGTN
ncbi:MAG TPA: DsbC family protein [Rudaea sp.]|nr:DsbC family protein [Rudaea sp.]